MKELIDSFMSSKLRNAWLQTDSVNMYVRKGVHIIDGQLTNTFDLASITIAENKRGCGLFKEIILYIESLGLPVYVESILNPKLADMLERHGYSLDADRFNAWKV